MDKRLVLLALTTLFVAAEVCAQMPGCFLWNNVMVVPKNPLTAKFVSRKVWYLHDGREVIEEMQGAVARDSLGRTYGEAHVTRSPARDPNVRISSIRPSVSVSGTDRRPVKILPLSKLAHVNTDPTAACRPRTFEGNDKGDATLFDRMTSSPWFPSNAVLE